MMARAARTAYTVSYDSENHISVLTQMWGSKWPEVGLCCGAATDGEMKTYLIFSGTSFSRFFLIAFSMWFLLLF